uniref:Uncharacterized protein n=1 Tax=Pithovirus LCPAC403 TaxID=2506596 RepID=A0A481ZFM8_9VIRU|nr:MAG: uncharacterized protein LCPAC403_04050 [Pithovirus LCPAC403]
MSFFILQSGEGFGYYSSFQEAKTEALEQKNDTFSIRKVSVNIYTRQFSEIGPDIKDSELSEQFYQVPEKLYTVGLPGTASVFHRTEIKAAYYNKVQLVMTERILDYMGYIENFQGPRNYITHGSLKDVYGLSYIYDMVILGDDHDISLEKVFSDMKDRGDMFEISLGDFGALRPMGFVHDTIEETHRIIFAMAKMYNKLNNLIGMS